MIQESLLTEPDGGTTYDAFLSYSHRDNRQVAVAVQRSLERFAKPWYRMRGLRVFRDDANLAANPDLWASIEAALARSSWLVVIGTPYAAQSPWVHREIQWWLAHRSIETILLVVASGEVGAFGSAGGTPGTAVPPVLSTALRAEPRWVDVREIDVGAKASRDQRERLLLAVADIAAAIHGRPKEELYGDALREHRRTIRSAGVAVSLLVVLVVALSIASMTAVTQLHAAQTQARVATSRQLASTADTLISTDLTTGLLVAAEAYTMDRSPVTRSALLRTVTSAPTLLRHLPADHPVTSVAAAADGGSLLAGTADGYLVRWDTARFERREQKISEGPVTLLSTSRDGTSVLAGSTERAYLWRPGSATDPIQLDGRAPVSLAISPSGATPAVLWRNDQPAGGATLRVYDGTGRPVSPAASVGGGDEEIGTLALDDDRSVLRIDPSGSWERRDARTLRIEQPRDFPLAPAGGFVPALSAGGRYYAYAKNDSVTVASTAPAVQPPADELSAEGFPTGEATALAISGDGSTVAVADAGTIYVAPTHPGTAARVLGAAPAITIVGIGPLNDNGVVFAGDRLLAGAGPDGVTVWDLGLRAGVVQRLGTLAAGPTAGFAPYISFSADHSRTLVVSGGGEGFTLRTGADRPYALRGPYGSALEGFPVLSPDGRTLYIVGPPIRGRVTTTDDPELTVADLPLDLDDRYSVLGAAPSADGSRVVVVDSTGAVHVFRTADRTIEQSWPGTQQPTPTPQAVSIAPDLARAAILTDRGVQMVDLATGARTDLPGGPATQAVFRGGRLLVRRPTSVLELWDPRGTAVSRTLPDSGYEGAIDLVEASGTLVRLRENGTVVLTDSSTEDDLGSFALPEPDGAGTPRIWGATTLLVDPRSPALLTATSGGELRRWNLDERAWLDAACRMAGRDLGPDDWQRYLGTTPSGDLRCGVPR